MTQMIFCIDLDGCLSDFNRGFGDLLRRRGHQIPMGEMPCWDWPRQFGVSAQEEGAAWREVNTSPDFWVKLPPLITAAGDIDAIRHAVSNGHWIYFTTQRTGETAKQQSERWLYELGIHNPTVLITSHKATIATALGATALLDDKPQNLYTGANLQTFLMSASYNSNFIPPPKNRGEFHPQNYKPTRVFYIREMLELLKAI